MGTSVISSGLMAQVDATRPTTNFDYATASAIRKPAGGGSAGEVRALLYFARPFQLRSTITSAKLVLFSGASAQVGTMSAVVQRIKTPVTFTKVTWNTKPTTFYAGTVTVTKTGPLAAMTMWEFDVTAMMQSVSLGDPWYGFNISTTTINPYLAFYDPSNASVNLRPRLEVEWSDEPSKPLTLAPSGGRAISVAKPVLRCDYVDVSGETDMQALQVQINSTTTFTSPAFDSGTVLSSTPELDLNTTAYAGLTDGQVVYWRVRVQDAAGLWSEWSDPAEFKRDGKGTLTLNNPSSGTPIVEESTPPFSWSFTGETQAAYQLTIVETDSDGLQRTWTSGKKTSTVTTVTPPVGVINSPDSTYTATLRVWDVKQRETIVGDPAYSEIVRNFTYVPSATVTATTSPTAVSQTPYPRVVVGWSRATDPDSFTILRNRQVIVSGLVPNDVRVSGTTFTWTDRSAPPQTTLAYEVQAVVGGKASASNPTVVTTMVPRGIWLADSSRANEVMITGKDDRAVIYGEDSEAITVIGATEAVIVTQAMRGMEGTITGELHGGHSGIATTAQQWRDKALKIKAQASKKCWLTLGDTTIQCVIRNLTVVPRPSTPLSFKISFDFYQVGTLQAGYVPTL